MTYMILHKDMDKPKYFPNPSIYVPCIYIYIYIYIYIIPPGPGGGRRQSQAAKNEIEVLYLNNCQRLIEIPSLANESRNTNPAIIKVDIN